MADEISIIVRAEDRFSSVLGNFGSIITGIESAINLAGQAFRAFTEFAMEGVNAVASYERLTLALTSLNAAQMVMADEAGSVAEAWGISSQKAEELAGWMQELAIHSPFTLEGVAQAFRLAMAYGFTADEAQRLTQALIDFSAGTGASEYNMQLIARALGQISTLGHLAGQDMLQLTSAGLPVAQILADAFHTTTDEIIRLRGEGLLPAQEVIEAITSWIETNFAGAADRFALSWSGLISTFSDLRQMGLREFFTGILEAIEPFVGEIAGFIQGPGIQFLSWLGDVIGKWFEHNAVIGAATDFLRVFNDYTEKGAPLLQAIGLTLRTIGENSDYISATNEVIKDLGTGFLQLQWALDQGMPFLQALEVTLLKMIERGGDLAGFAQIVYDVAHSFRSEEGLSGAVDTILGHLEDLETKWQGTPLGNIITDIRTFIETGTEEGWGTAIGNLFSGVKDTILGLFDNLWEGVDWQTKIQGLVNSLVIVINSTNWTSVGNTIATVLGGVLTTVFITLPNIVNSVDWGPFGLAVWTAMKEAIVAVFTNESLLDAVTNETLGGRVFQISTFSVGIQKLSFLLSAIALKNMADLAADIVQGIADGMADMKINIDKWVDEHIVQPVKDFLGISSPSTVFYEIGRNIVLGLIGGIGSMIAPLLTVLQVLLAPIMALLNPVLELLGFDTATGTGGASATSTLGNVSTVPLSTASTINNYFYGPVYFGNLEQLGYDCPSPHPLVAATGRTLLTTSNIGT